MFVYVSTISSYSPSSVGRKGRTETFGFERCEASGKTTLVKLFAREFDVFIELNLEEKENARLFAGEVSFDDLLAGIYAKAGVRMENKRTLIFIDEIQNEPEAVRSLRYFMRNVLIFM